MVGFTSLLASGQNLQHPKIWPQVTPDIETPNLAPTHQLISYDHPKSDATHRELGMSLELMMMSLYWVKTGKGFSLVALDAKKASER